MRVTKTQRLHGGRGHDGTENSWHLGHPTWREKDLGVLIVDGMAGWQVARRLMAASREPFMAPSDSKPRLKLSKVDVFWGNIPPAVLRLNHSVSWSEHLPPQAAGRDIMEGRFPLCRDESVEHGRCSRCRGGHGLGSTRKEEEEVNSTTHDEVSPGERWFNQETSTAEQRALFQLEKELEPTFRFEHGGRKQASPLWVTRILLGQLFRERLALGQAVKAFAKFQRREITRSLVKVNDLEELVEPPLGGVQEASTFGTSREELRDMEMEDAMRDMANEDPDFSTGEVRVGLL